MMTCSTETAIMALAVAVAIGFVVGCVAVVVWIGRLRR